MKTNVKETDWERRFRKAVSLGPRLPKEQRSQSEREGGFKEHLCQEIIDAISEIALDKVELGGLSPLVYPCVKLLYETNEDLKRRRDPGRAYKNIVARLEGPEPTPQNLSDQLKKARAIIELILADDAPPGLISIKREIREECHRILQTLGEVEPEDIRVLQKIKRGTTAWRKEKFDPALEKLVRLKLIEYSLSPNMAVPTDIREPTVTPFGDEILEKLTWTADLGKKPMY